MVCNVSCLIYLVSPPSHPLDMIIGFAQRHQNVPENASHLMDQFPVAINISVPMISERIHKIMFHYHESINTARVGTLTQQDDLDYDAFFGTRQNTKGDSIVDIMILNSGNDTIPSLRTLVQNDIRPEEQECYTINIITTDIEGVRELFTCNEDESNLTDFFCDHTICIDDDDGQFTNIFSCTLLS